jgi:PAS domain S-box-containing protein
MHGRPTTKALSPVQAGGQSQSIPLWIVVLLALLFLLCVAKLCLDRNDSLSIITLGLAAAVLPLGVNLMRRERRKTIAEKNALAREVEQHNRFFGSSLDLILVTDSRGNFARVSPSSKAILGYEPDEMVGHVGTEFIHPDDLDATRREMQLARRGREMRNFETRYVHKSGEAVPLTWTGVWSEAEHLHFFIGRDMSVQKRFEQAEREAKETLAAIIDASPVAIFCLDPQRKVLVWSRAAEQMFGYSARETVGRPYMLVPPDGKDEYDDLFERALTGETLRDIRVKRNRKDGSSLDISFDAAAMYEGERVKAIAYALMDITERNKLEQQLRQSQKLDSIGQLTGGVAHDFNNVLSVVTGNIVILAEGVADKP